MKDKEKKIIKVLQNQVEPFCLHALENQTQQHRSFAERKFYCKLAEAGDRRQGSDLSLWAQIEKRMYTVYVYSAGADIIKKFGEGLFLWACIEC